MTPETAQRVALAIAVRLRHDQPELTLRDAHASDQAIAADLLPLVSWIAEKALVDQRLGRVGAIAICDRLLAGGFPRRSLLRAIGMLRGELVERGLVDAATAGRLTAGILDRLADRLTPDGSVHDVQPAAPRARTDRHAVAPPMSMARVERQETR